MTLSSASFIASIDQGVNFNAISVPWHGSFPGDTGMGGFSRTPYDSLLRPPQSAVELDCLIRVERRVYVERVGEEPETMRRADIAVIAVDSGPATGILSQVPGTISVECDLPMPIERRGGVRLPVVGSSARRFLRDRQSSESSTTL